MEETKIQNDFVPYRPPPVYPRPPRVDPFDNDNIKKYPKYPEP